MPPPKNSRKNRHRTKKSTSVLQNVISNSEIKTKNPILQSQNHRYNVICCISNSKSRLMIDVVVHYCKQIGIETNIIVLERSDIMQNRICFSESVDMSIRNQFLRKLNFIPVQTLDLSVEIREELNVDNHMYFLDQQNHSYIAIDPQKRSEVILDAELVFSFKELRLDRHNIHVQSETEEGLRKMLQVVDPFVGGVECSKVCSISENKIKYGGANSELLGFLQGFAESLGVKNIKLQQSWDDSDKDIFIQIQDPSIVGKPIQDWMPLLVACDDPILEQEIVSRFYERGFKKARMATFEERKQKKLGFTIFENSYKEKDPLGKITLEIKQIMNSILESKVDLQDYPIQIDTGSSHQYGCLLHCPIEEYRQGMSPYAGDVVGAYPIVISTNKPSLFVVLKEKLKEVGYNVKFREQEESETQIAHVSWGLFSKHSQASNLLGLLEQYIKDAGIIKEIFKVSDVTSKSTSTILGLPIVRDLSCKKIEISLFTQVSPRFLRRKSHYLRRFRVVLNVVESEPVFHEIQEKLEEMGLRRIEGRGSIPDAPSDNTIHFGMAPSWLIAQIYSKTQIYFDSELPVTTEETFIVEDRDIYIFLPKKGKKNNKRIQRFDPQAWLKRDEDSSHNIIEDQKTKNILDLQSFLGPAPFIKKIENKLRIGHQSLDITGLYKHPLTPRIDDFQHYCLDSQTAILCERISESITYREPLLLEGVTSTSKTSSILFLAACLGQPTMRINLSGATDVSEFVGRFIPNENSDSNSWCWEDGPIVKAMMNGYWVILDELNLAEPSILERLNSILEKNPKLLLSEHNDRLIGGLEYPLHQKFRVFATQNPVTYAGRNPLSPAYRDRFHEIQVKDPNIDPDMMLTMLHWIVFKKIPQIDVFGTKYKGICILHAGEQNFERENISEKKQKEIRAKLKIIAGEKKKEDQVLSK